MAAIFAQRLVDQLILVNNGSADDLAPWRGRLAAESRVTLLEGHGNIGFGRAVNLAAERVDTDLMLVLNPDGILPTEGLPAAVGIARSDPSVGLVGARVLGVDGAEQRGSRRRFVTPTSLLEDIGARMGLLGRERSLYQHGRPWPEPLLEVDCCSGAFLLARTAAFRALGGFDPGYFLHVEDLDLCLRVNRAGLRTVIPRDLAVIHVGGTSDAPSRWIEWQKIRGWRRYFGRNFPAGPDRWLAPLAFGIVLAFHLTVIARSFIGRRRGVKSASEFG